MQYGDFVFCAMDPVINQAAKLHYMSNGTYQVPLVLRLPVGATSRGAQHAQSTETYFMHTPGLKVVCPSNPYDAKGLLLASIWDNNPVVFLGSTSCSTRVKVGARRRLRSIPSWKYLISFTIPLGSVAIRREGTDISILANMLMVYRSLQAADRLAEEGISAEVIDVRCLAPLDIGTMVEFARKTSRVLIVEEDNLTAGWAAEVAARLAQEAIPLSGDVRVTRIAAPDTPVPCAASLEQVYLPDVETIVNTVKQLIE